MWLVQRIRREPESLPESAFQSQGHTATVPFEGLDDEDERTRIQTRPNLVIAKAPKPANFDKLDTYEQYTEGSLELVEPLPEALDREDSEDTEDVEESNLPGIDLPPDSSPGFTNIHTLEDALGSDDTLPFVQPTNHDLKP